MRVADGIWEQALTWPCIPQTWVKRFQVNHHQENVTLFLMHYAFYLKQFYCILPYIRVQVML